MPSAPCGPHPAVRTLDESKIEAGFDYGLLTIRIPKAALPQPKRIAIQGGNAGDGQIEAGHSGENAQK